VEGRKGNGEGREAAVKERLGRRLGWMGWSGDEEWGKGGGKGILKGRVTRGGGEGRA